MGASEEMLESLRVFTDDVVTFVEKKWPWWVGRWQRKIYNETFALLVMRTPVRTGNTRANWQVTRTQFSTRYFPAMKDPDGAATIAKGKAVIAKIERYGNAYFVNNVPHINVLEEGSSTQAPDGWIALTLAEMEEKYKLVDEEIE